MLAATTIREAMPPAPARPPVSRLRTSAFYPPVLTMSLDPFEAKQDTLSVALGIYVGPLRIPSMGAGELWLHRGPPPRSGRRLDDYSALRCLRHAVVTGHSPNS
ncbi:hypothetical protein ENSA5_64550 [Enhygromyxa salina]|uniref:Uncharacterized protein n=1 Tax=Enhygromyxa salina TaxID=215803 RepID=A0A2S9XCN3_9BACT|nr:hypothetical protein ENSA5_64550 [Enhygromyxa salina]